MHRTTTTCGLVLASSVAIACSDAALESRHQSTDPWSDIAVGSLLYARADQPPDVLRMGDVEQPEYVLDNSPATPEVGDVSALHPFINRRHTFPVRVVSEDWLEILPEANEGTSDRSAFSDPYGPQPAVYVESKHFSPLSSADFEPIQVFDNRPGGGGATPPQDKLIVILADRRPRIFAFESGRMVLASPVVLGRVQVADAGGSSAESGASATSFETPPGHHRVYWSRVSDNMTGYPGVPFTNYFATNGRGAGFAIHGSPWWNWAVKSTGGYGSHGCVNVPDDEWHMIDVDGEPISVAQWIYRWVGTNLQHRDIADGFQYTRVDASDPGWGRHTRSVHTMVVRDLRNLVRYPAPGRFDAEPVDWQPIVEEVAALGDNWLLPHRRGGVHILDRVPVGAIATDTSMEGFDLLPCNDPSQVSRQVYPDVEVTEDSRTVGEVCTHLRVERGGSTCTPERVDLRYLGERILCDEEAFAHIPANMRAELISHERVHLQQFAGVFGDLVRQEIAAADDLSHGRVEYDQRSVVGITELMAQTHTRSLFGERSVLGDDYTFALAVPDGDRARGVESGVGVDRAWEHLHHQCNDPSGVDPQLRAELYLAASGDAEAYAALESRCTWPLHRLVPDRERN